MPGAMRVTRFSVSLPQPLVDELDETCKNMRYTNRSKAVHDALRSFITEFEWMRTEVGWITGVILVLYHTNRPGLVEKIVKAQHEYSNVVSSSTHLHLEKNKCLEIISVKGNVEEVRGLSQVLMTGKGVKQVKVAAIAP